MSEKLLKVVGISELKKSSNNRDYYTISFKAQKMVGNLLILNNQKVYHRNVWGAFQDEKGNKFNADPLFLDVKTGELQIGTYVEGSCMTFNTSVYTIGDSERPLTSFTTVVFANEYHRAHDIANSQLKQNHATTIDEFGNPTAPQNMEKKETAIA